MGATTGVSGDGAAGAAQPEAVGQPLERRAAHDPYRSPHRLLVLWRSTIGKKYVAPVSGMVLAIFVLLHMAGNLKAIEGAGGGHPALDRYAHFLRTVGSPVLPHDFALWFERIVLFAALVLHLASITQLWLRNRRAKPPRQRAKRVRSTIAARTMP